VRAGSRAEVRHIETTRVRLIVAFTDTPFGDFDMFAPLGQVEKGRTISTGFAGAVWVHPRGRAPTPSKDISMWERRTVA
jgi:hypothetical protein